MAKVKYYYDTHLCKYVPIKTSIGDLAAVVKMDPAAGNKEQPYHVKIVLDKFDPGKLLNQGELLGPVTMTAGIDGSGLDINTMKISFAFFDIIYENTTFISN